MKKDLEFFINEPIVLEIYKNEYNWDDVDYEADVESATSSVAVKPSALTKVNF